MIISEEQVRRAIGYLCESARDSGDRPAVDPSVGVAPELVDRVREELARIPDTRDDRVAEARAAIAAAELRSDEVAVKMIGRILSDRIR